LVPSLQIARTAAGRSAVDGEDGGEYPGWFDREIKTAITTAAKAKPSSTATTTRFVSLDIDFPFSTPPALALANFALMVPIRGRERKAKRMAETPPIPRAPRGLDLAEGQAASQAQPDDAEAQKPPVSSG
jgi:hypothetical protein